MRRTRRLRQIRQNIFCTVSTQEGEGKVSIRLGLGRVMAPLRYRRFSSKNFAIMFNASVVSRR
jgi:hypothetical protein